VHGQRADDVAFEGEHSRGLGALAAHITHRHAPRGRLRGVVPVPLPSHRRGRRSRHRRLPHPQVVTSSLPRRRVSRARGQDTRLESADDLVAPLCRAPIFLLVPSRLQHLRLSVLPRGMHRLRQKADNDPSSKNGGRRKPCPKSSIWSEGVGDKKK
jgi:hypothetical protein